MPLEIRELHIRVSVNQEGGKSQTQQAPSSKAAGDKDDKEAIINQCIEQVVDMFNSKKER
jgi:hypothetical protein